MLQSNNLQLRFILFIVFLVAALFLNVALADPTPVTSASPAAAQTSTAPATQPSATSAAPIMPAAQAPSVITYNVQYVNPQQIVATLQKLYGSQINVATQQQQLLIRGNPAQLAEIQTMLPSLDKAPRQLLISVRQNVPLSQLQNYYNMGNGQLSGTPTEQNYATQDRGSAGDQAEIQATEGQPAHIGLTQSVPLITGVGQYPLWGPPGGGGGGGAPGAGAGGYVGYSYANLMTGFNVIAQIVNNTALLDIDAFNGAPVANSYQNTQTAAQHTTLRVPLGQWALIGGTGVLDNDSKKVTTYGTGRTNEQATSQQAGATIIRVNVVGN